MKVNMRAKKLAVLKSNLRFLPQTIAFAKASRRIEHAERSERILEDTKAELRRRGHQV